MKKLRNALLAGVGVVAMLVISTPSKADLPVIDIAALVQWAKSEANWLQGYILQNKQYITQTQQYLTQIQQYYTEVQMFINWVHMPSLGGALGLMQFAGLGSYLPVQPLALLGVVNGLSSAASGNLSLGGISGLLGSFSALANQAFTTNHVYSPTDGSWGSQQINAEGASIAGTQGVGLASYQGLQSHMADQQALRDHLLGASSPKDVEDAQAQIALEQAWTENQNGQLLATMVTYEAQRDSREQRGTEKATQEIDQWLAASGTGYQ